MNKKVLFRKFVEFTTSVHNVTHELRKKSKSDTVTPVQYGILEYLYVNEPVTPSEISDCQKISMPNTSRELKKLSEKKLIEKVEDEGDRRKQYIRLSKDGKKMMDSSFHILEAQFLARLQDASEEDLEEIQRAMDILHTKIFY